MSSLGLSEALLVFVSVSVCGLLFILPLWKIVRKAGFEPPLSFPVFIPLVNIVMIYVFAIVNWPSLKREQRSKNWGLISHPQKTLAGGPFFAPRHPRR
jgi:hypothetical protein